MQLKPLQSLAAILAVVATIGLSDAGSMSPSLFDKIQGIGGLGGGHDAVLQLPSVMSKVLSNPALSGLSGDAKTEAMIGLMKQFTSASQLPFLSTLSSLGGVEEVTPFFITNKIGLKNAPAPVLQALSMLPGEFSIREPIPVKLNLPLEVNEEEMEVSRAERAAEVQWGVQKIGAPTVWSMKTNGTGIIVANIDTGVYVNHEALKGNYAGRWKDAIGSRTTPYDDHGHGSHTMGSICGTARGIGVAPGAKWIACKGLDSQGSGTDVSLSNCAQWVLQQKPRVVSNSWGGGKGQTWFNDEIAAWQNANIIPVFSIGNEGSKCRTAGSPGDQDNLISVGSTRKDDTMSTFSSRGTSSSGKLKPEVSAPGESILSAGRDSQGSTSYVTMSGTSMASPHVAGAVALMLAGDTSLKFASIRTKLQDTATRPSSVTTADLSCGKPANGGNYPNNAYGYGRINVQKAMGL